MITTASRIFTPISISEMFITIRTVVCSDKLSALSLHCSLFNVNCSKTAWRNCILNLRVGCYYVFHYTMSDSVVVCLFLSMCSDCSVFYLAAFIKKIWR